MNGHFFDTLKIIIGSYELPLALLVKLIPLIYPDFSKNYEIIQNDDNE